MSAQQILLGLLGPQFDDRRFYPFGKYSTPPFKGNTPDNFDIITSLPNGYYPIPVHASTQNLDPIFEPFSSGICPWFNNINLNSLKSLHKYINEINKIIDQTPVLKNIIREIKNKKSLKFPYIKDVLEAHDLINYLRGMQSLGQTFDLISMETFPLKLSQDILSLIHI